MSLPEPLESVYRPPFPVDPWLTIAPLRHGSGDPTIRFERDGIRRASRTPEGPATTHLRLIAGEVHVTAWGDGRAWAVDAVPRLLGSEDEPGRLAPGPGLLRDLVRRHPGLRLGRSDWVLGSLVPAVCEQKVTGVEARRSYRALVRLHGDPAPGPGGLRLPPAPERLARLSYWALHPAGLERRRAETLRRAAERAAWLEAASELPPVDALARLGALPGLGPWTAAETARAAFGDADAISLGDYHLPRLVSWSLAGEEHGDDTRMLELLEPYRGQRARVVRLLELSGLHAPRHGPRLTGRSIAGI